MVFVDSIMDILSDNLSAVSRNAACTNIISRTNALITTFSGMTWEDGAGTLASGMLRICRSSATYWRVHPISTFWGGVTDTGQNPTEFIVGDCIGYLAGWGSALESDSSSEGGITPEGQWHRIRQGLIWGAAGSLVGP